jgi:hypothetical protein
MLYDNYELEDSILVSLPVISTEKSFKLADIFTFLTSLTHFYYGNKDLIMDTQDKVLYVNGFNFKADLAAISEALYEMRFDKEAQEVLQQFDLPTESILTVKQLMNVFVNNLEVRDLIIAGMRKADSLRQYRAFKKLYDSLMTVELTFDHFKNPETGDFYRDADGDATYSAFLEAEDSVLYYKLVEIELIDDDESRENTIVNIIDSIVYVLEEWIDSDKFAGIFHSLPGVSIDAIKQYIMLVINFYKSYKTHILGINTIYYFDDPNEGYIQLIDDLLLNRWFEKDEALALLDKLFKTTIKLEPKEMIRLKDRVYFDISTWKYKGYTERIKLTDYRETILRMIEKSTVNFSEEIAGVKIIYDEQTAIPLFDYPEDITITKEPDDSIELTDKMWITATYD